MFKLYFRIVIINNTAVMSQIYVFAALIFCVTVRSSVCTFMEQRSIIVGGRDATIEERPYMVSFQQYNQHRCGGTLIKPNVVVTAAHCMAPYYRPEDLITLNVRAGSTNKSSGGEVANIIRYYTHPNYNKFTIRDYDVSVLILDRNLPLTSAIQTVPLQAVNTEMPTGTVGTISGWGGISKYAQETDILQTLDVPKISQEDCMRWYSLMNVTDRMFCFGYVFKGKDSCTGDSGGPLIVEGHLAGIISAGRSCGFIPGLYVKVAHEEIYNHILQSSEEE